MPISEPTAVFSIRDDRDMEIKQAVLQVYRALEEKGYNPINQLVGYILSEDPTYITTYKNARAIIRRIDRDDAHAPHRQNRTQGLALDREDVACGETDIHRQFADAFS